MRYNIQKVIEGLQKIQEYSNSKGYNDDLFIEEDELLTIAMVRVNCIDEYIKRFDLIQDKDEYFKNYDWENYHKGGEDKYFCRSEFYTITDTAKLMNVQRKTIYDWIDKGIINVIYSGKLSLIRLSELEENLKLIQKRMKNANSLQILIAEKQNIKYETKR